MTLLLLLLGATAAPPSAEFFYRDARAAFRRGDIAGAGVIASAALQRFGNSDDAWVWKLRCVEGDVLLNKGRYDDARQLLQRPLPAALAGSDVEVLRLQGLALAAHRLKNSSAAMSLVARAYDIAKKRQPQTLPMLLVIRATIDSKNSPKWAREAVQAAQQSHDVGVEARARGTIAFDLANHERFDEAVTMWEAALPQARQSGNESLVQKYEGNLGWGYMELGDYEAAGDYFARAQAAATRLGVKVDAVPWTYQLGNVRLQMGDQDGAGKLYRQAYALATETTHAQKPIILAYLANYELQAGRLAAAQKYSDESLRERRAAKDVDGELRSLLIAGRIATAAGKLGEGERLLTDVIARSESISTKWEAHGRLAQLYVKCAKFDQADREFRQLLDTARTARANVQNKELRFSFFTAISELFDSYIDHLVARGRAAEALGVTETIRAQTLEEGLTDAVPPRDSRVIAREKRATILCYWLGSAHSYLWIVTPQKIDVVTLPPRRTIEAALDAYRRDLLGTRGSLAMSGQRGIALWRVLVEPASRVLTPGARVIVVPDGRLHTFNMEALVAPSPKPHYWIEDAIISTASSLTLLHHDVPKRSTTPRLLLVGNAPPPPSTDFRLLPLAAVEMEKVASHFDRASSVVLSGAKATPSAYRSSSPASFTYLHFVAHGVATRQKPLDSAIVLAREGEAFKLYARDIAKQPITARLVTISSCHGAGTRAYAGEGLVGLGWAFQRAGAANVIAALWEVSDSFTPELMDRMYAGIRAGHDPAVALRDAKLALVRREGPERRPSYWAPFVLYAGS